MAARATIASQLRKRGACSEALEWLGRRRSAARAWRVCHRADWMFWALQRARGLDRKRFVSVACECARLVLDRAPAGEDRPRVAIETAEAWVRGEATIEQVRAAAYAAADAAYAAYASADAAYAADDAAYAAYAAADAAYAAYAGVDASAAADAAYAASAAADAAYAAADAAYAAYAAADAAYAGVDASAAYASAAAAAAYTGVDAEAAEAADAARATARATARALAARNKMCARCADIVRKHFPEPPVLR